MPKKPTLIEPINTSFDNLTKASVMKNIAPTKSNKIKDVELKTNQNIAELQTLDYNDEKKEQYHFSFDDKKQMIWGTVKQIALTFECSTQNIEHHIKKVFRDQELDKNAVTKDYLVTASDGKPYSTKHYNIDMIIADKINIQQEFLKEELENIQKKIDGKKSVFQKVKYEISFLNKRKKLVEEELVNFAPISPTNTTQLNTSNQSGQDFTREEAKVLVISILQEINNPAGLRISEVSQYAEQNHNNSYSNLSGSRIRRAMVDLVKEGKIIATNPDNKKFIKYIINNKEIEDNNIENLME